MIAAFFKWFQNVALLVMTGCGGALISGRCAAAPLFETAPLFTPTSSNYYHIPGLAVTTKGTVPAYAAWRDVAANDWGRIYVTMRRSGDGGKTWSPEKLVAPGGTPPPAIVRSSPPKPKGKEDDIVVDNCMVIPDQNGAVHMLYCVEYRRVFYMRSDDDGLTWSPPAEISQVFEKYRSEMDWKIIATGPGHGIQLKNGRMIVPLWIATGGKLQLSDTPGLGAILTPKIESRFPFHEEAVYRCLVDPALIPTVDWLSA